MFPEDLKRLDFNPRSPHGERHGLPRTHGRSWKFQSTLPARGATAPYITNGRAFSISIHAPRTGSDNPAFTAHIIKCISIHAPRTGSDTLM